MLSIQHSYTNYFLSFLPLLVSFINYMLYRISLCLLSVSMCLYVCMWAHTACACACICACEHIPCVHVPVCVHLSTYRVCMWSLSCFSTLGFETGTIWGLLISLVTIIFTDPTAHQLTRQADQQASGSSWCWGSAGHHHTQILLGRLDQTQVVRLAHKPFSDWAISSVLPLL